MKITKILFIAVQGIGNTLMAVPAFKVLRENFPNAVIDLLTIKPVEQLIRNCPYINNVYVINKKIEKDFLKNIHVVLSLRKKNYDISITTFPAAQPHFNLLAVFIGAKKRITHDYKKNFVWLQNIRVPIRIVHDVKQNLNLLQALGITPKKQQRLELWLKKEDRKFADNFFKKNKIKKAVGIHPGSSAERGMTTKRWPLKKFAKLSDILIKKHNFKVLVFLGPNERELRIIKNMVKNKSELLIIKESVRNVASLISKCKLFISNDSGLMHIAVACKVPTIGIFGSTDYRRTAPYGEKTLIVKENIPKKFLQHSIENLGKKIYYDIDYFKNISVNKVYNASKKLLKTKK